MRTNKELLPTEVLDVVLRAVAAIYTEAAAISKGLIDLHFVCVFFFILCSFQGNVMSGDDLLPILIFVALRAKLEKPFAMLQYAVSFVLFVCFSQFFFQYDLCANEELQGEAGYYLTTLVRIFWFSLFFFCFLFQIFFRKVH